MARLDEFIRNLVDYGLEYFELYYGVYRAQVTRNDDPEGQARVRVKVPALAMPDDAAVPHWAYPMVSGYPVGEGKGDYKVPDVGDYVFVMFEGGKVHSPLYYPGGWFARGEKPDEFETPDDRGFKTSSGHVFRTRDAGGDESLLVRHKGGTQVEVNSAGAVLMETQAGDKLELDTQGDALFKHASGSQILMDLTGLKVEAKNAAGATITLDGPNATVESAAQVTLKCTRLVLNGAASVELGGGAISPLIKGDTFVAWLGTFVAWAAAHVHVPLTPPIAPPPPPPIPAFLSLISKTV